MTNFKENSENLPLIKASPKNVKLSYEDAREFARSLKLESSSLWSKYIKGELPHLPPIPKEIPKRPDTYYRRRNEWKGWPDFLNTKYWSPRDEGFMSFDDAREFARSLGLMHKAEWIRYQEGKLPHLPSFPKGMPSRPDRTYSRLGNWTTWEDFLNTKWKAKKVPFIEYKYANAFVIQLKLKTYKQWMNYCKGAYPDLPPLPKYIPANPVLAYPNQWVSYGEWLGTGRIAHRKRKYWTFEHARRFVRSLKLKSGTEWTLYCKGKLSGHGIKPDEIPHRPEFFYKEWDGLADWLGNGKEKGKAHVFWPYEKAHKYVLSLKLRTRRNWYEYRRGEISRLPKCNKNIPGNPSEFYKDKGWVGWRVWLTGKTD